MKEGDDCIYTRTLAARLDLGKTGGLFNHIKECASCKESYRLIKENRQKIEECIPVEEISPEEIEKIVASSRKILENIYSSKKRPERGLLTKLFRISPLGRGPS